MDRLTFATYLAPNVLPVYEAVAEEVGRRLAMPTELGVETSYESCQRDLYEVCFVCSLPYVTFERQGIAPAVPGPPPVLAGGCLRLASTRNRSASWPRARSTPRRSTRRSWPWLCATIRGWETPLRSSPRWARPPSSPSPCPGGFPRTSARAFERAWGGWATTRRGHVLWPAGW